MPLPVVLEEQSPQIRVIVVADAEEIVHLALLPVGDRPDGAHRRDDGVLPGHPRRQHEVMAVGGRVEVVDHLEAPLGDPIDGRMREQHIEGEARVIAQVSGDGGQPRRRDGDRGPVGGFLALLDAGFEASYGLYQCFAIHCLIFSAHRFSSAA
jgi:hypothetical protein